MQHERAHAWFAAYGSKAWASCPLTQNGVLRIVGHARYPNSPGTPAAVAAVLRAMVAHRGHEFWPDNVTLLEGRYADARRLLDAGQVSDSYLLALAAARGGQLATFDRRLVTNAVTGGAEALHAIT